MFTSMSQHTNHVSVGIGVSACMARMVQLILFGTFMAVQLYQFCSWNYVQCDYLQYRCSQTQLLRPSNVLCEPWPVQML